MPEGPFILILKEEVEQFIGQQIISVSGNCKIGIERLQDQIVLSFKSWGKHFLICFESFTVKIHLLLFGSYRINERKETIPQLRLNFFNGELNFYTCSVKFLEGNTDAHYDWSADVMSTHWDAKKAYQKLKINPEIHICDALLNQDIFSGVGNIIKNEVLYRTFVQPESLIKKIPTKVRKVVIDGCSIYSFQFQEWKKKYELKKKLACTHQKTLPSL